jgi:hypothetical protein
LSRLGETAPFYVEPDRRRFGPGSTLYFLSDGAKANPYGLEAVYELELVGKNVGGQTMPVHAAAPVGQETHFYWKRIELEENKLYQPGLVDAPDLWLWELLLAPVTKSFAFPVSELAAVSGNPRLELWVQGTSDLPATPDHHVRVYVNGTLVSEDSFEGKKSRYLTAELGPGILQEGQNLLALENVGDTGAAYSTIMLSRFAVTYPRRQEVEDGKLEGVWASSGAASISGVTETTRVLDVTESRSPIWLQGVGAGAGTARFRAEAGRKYLVVAASALREPSILKPAPRTLKSRTNEAEYLIVGPRALLDAAQPLLNWRAGQGLKTKAVAIEDVFSEFGHGEPRPEAVRSFLSYAYHEWAGPALRYVVLLGDATYDFKDYSATGVKNQVPPLMVRTSYLWTVSDPTLAAVNGDDPFADLAIGRIPAASSNEVHIVVDKILAYEAARRTVAGPTVLIADNPDRAGDFVADAERVASRLPAGTSVLRIYLPQLGAATGSEVTRAFNEGASLMSYVGHGGIHLWADENIFNRTQVSSLSAQPQQPFLLTMNCLNGYFHFPYFNSLSEELLKAEAKGVIAAFSPSGMSLNAPAQRMHQALVDQLFTGRHRRLGDALLAAQSDYLQSGSFLELLSIYHLLGDPALVIR